MTSTPALNLEVLVGNSTPVCSSEGTMTCAASAQFFVSRRRQCGGAWSVFVASFFYVHENEVSDFRKCVSVCVWHVASISRCIQSLVGDFTSGYVLTRFICVCAFFHGSMTAFSGVCCILFSI